MSLLIGTWSERDDPAAAAATGIPGAERDCTHGDYLQGLLHGSVRIPAAYTVAMRELFEQSEGLPPFRPGAAAGTVQETGLLNFKPCDLASSRLFGVVLRQGYESELPTYLNTAGLGICLSGMGAGLPSGYLGPHSVFFVSLGNGSLLVYDELPPMLSAPTRAAASTILAWHRRNPLDIRIVREDEFAGMGPKENAVITVQYFPPTQFTIVGSIASYSFNLLISHPIPAKTEVIAKPSGASAMARVTIDGVDYGLVSNGGFAGLLIPWAQLTWVAGKEPVGPPAAVGTAHTVQLLVDGAPSGAIVNL